MITPESHDGFVSVGTRLAAGTMAVLTLVCSVSFFQLASRERERTLDAKRVAAEMLTSLFATSVAAPLDFGDADAVDLHLHDLRENPAVARASVWVSGASTPIASSPTGISQPVPADVNEATEVIREDEVEALAPIINRRGIKLGVARVVFSLAQENAALSANRRALPYVSVLLACLTGALLILLARRQIVAPLEKLVDAARRVEAGAMSAPVDISSRDEIGRLARAWNAMGAAVVDRERRLADREHRLADANQSLRELLQHMQAAEALKKSEERFRGFFELTADPACIMDGDGFFRELNQAWEKGIGYSREELKGRPFVDFVHVEDRESTSRAIQGRAEGGEIVIGFQNRSVHKNGRTIWLEWTFRSTGTGGQVFAIARDITERKETEERPQRSEARYRASFENASVGEVLTSLDGRLVEVNRAVAAILGYEPAELVGMKFAELTHPEDLGSSLEVPHELVEGQQVAGIEKRFRKKNGSPTWVALSNAPLRDPAGRVSHFVTHIIDISKRKHAEQMLSRSELELNQARKLEAVGQLAAGIAHEINTPIQYVGDSLKFLKEGFSDLQRLIASYRDALGGDALPPEIRQLEEERDLEYLLAHVSPAFERCFDGVGRVSRIVHAMKDFAHSDQLGEKNSADINRALESTLLIARNEYKYVADVETELGDVPPVVCDLGELNQVFLNLIVNATHAIADVVGDTGAKGKIRLSTWREGNCVFVEVADTGAGIPESIWDRVFEPFFTTKAVGKGSGQGLAIARCIVVDKHGGTLTFESTMGKGTTFRIRLPLDGHTLAPPPPGGH